MPEDCGCRKQEPQKDFLTRREFIKTSGVIAASAALASTPLRLKRPPGAPLASVDLDTLKLALIIATADAMYLEAEAEIKALGMALDSSADNVKYSDATGSLIGLVLSHNFSTSKRMGADLALTVDASTGVLTSVQMLIGWSLVDMLDISSITLDYRDVLETISGQNKDGAFSVLIRPTTENHWSFPYQNAPPFLPIDLVETGWPPHAEDPNAGYWHYANGVKAEWLTDRGAAVYRITQVKETNVLFGDQFTDLPLSQS